MRKPGRTSHGHNLKGWTPGKLIGWFDHLEESFSHKEVQFKKFCLPVKTSCPPAETPDRAPYIRASHIHLQGILVVVHSTFLHIFM